MLRASSGRYCLTPKGEFYLIGYGSRYESRRKPAQGVHDDIFARVVLLEVDGTEIYMFNADYLEFEEWSCDEIKGMMAREYGLNENCILFSATHDHHSCLLYTSWARFAGSTGSGSGWSFTGRRNAAVHSNGVTGKRGRWKNGDSNVGDDLL